VREIMDELFGEKGFVSQIAVFKTTTPRVLLDNNIYYVLWYSKSVEKARYYQLFANKDLVEWTRDTLGGSWGFKQASFIEHWSLRKRKTLVCSRRVPRYTN